jgi:hypothetical protein
MSFRRYQPAALLFLAVLIIGCGSAGPLVDPSVVPYQPLTGRVVDAVSGQPAAGVSVFLAGTSHRATTDDEGRFFLSRVPAGVYKIAAHQPGYAPIAQDVSHSAPTGNSSAANSPRDAEVVIRLSTTGAAPSREGRSNDASGTDLSVEAIPEAVRESIQALQERVDQVEARMALMSRQMDLLRDEQRGTTLLSMNEAELKTFEAFFLGKDRKECELLNPGVLSFKAADRRSDVVLEATTDQPLEVLNRRLGYRLRVVLDAFSVARTRQETAVLEDALISFEPLEPSSEDVAERWRKARHEAYEGSLVHLLRALGAGRAEKEDFSVERPLEVKRRTSSSLAGRTYTASEWVPLRDLDERVVTGAAPFVRMLRLEGKHRVRHGSTGSEEWYVSLSKNVEPFTVLGQPLAPGAVWTEGYWPVRPLCYQLPSNYVPDAS